MTVGFKTLVLSSDYRPISVFPLYTIDAEEAIHRIVKGNATAIINYNRPVLTQNPNIKLLWPSVICNHNSFAYRENVRLSDETLYYRDHGKCQYCHEPLALSRAKKNSLTFDHVIPTSKGGTNDWNNIVAACTPCNSMKADFDPKGRWVPARKPYTPSFFELVEIRKNFPIVVDDERWLQFLGEWKAAVIVKEHMKEYTKDE